MNKIKWWGYLHQNGEVQVKRWLGDMVDCFEAEKSPFVQEVVYPFEASSRDKAIIEINKRLGRNNI